MTDDRGRQNKGGVSRRSFLKASASTAALFGAVNTQFPFGVPMAFADAPEVTKATLGFIALTDAAPLFVAKEKGLFAKYGMPDVEVAKQASWGATRDNLVLGGEANGIDGAHILYADALPDQRRQGDAEQPADADVHPGAAQSERSVHLGRQGICRPQGRRRRHTR